MINFLSKPAKWQEIPKNDSAYLKHFSKALLNFEQNQLEEKRSIRTLPRTHKKAGY